ncbi:trifunctional purine biosynthetic protein adenosine-3 Gart [Nomia melanderi]|uniref:trifunctional purine biosynthetic protein adenosine-3 Gart n=1 Tax=Nomia melanderi TaxID=2448451 RepID=UPI0013047333|nr:trifunctional purine biosynthetic protein adenosine-3 [Nomia melanderi]XP_031834272.1 trifunctional purine biosynthetic protein adenosine-3 [Nomia melanderi]XP_031834273.1 trifunctional purine biosynthetic protein adenosine-3 [Nomia melanderi]XP_031834274.1 trifunctional purine biosynthetic protein adenosine-3 [Nomia melanderi]XP_031834275.1 trifunctional purine biosynthetic protein adenosine-3 [Nomia melanderi]XP_031834276.1 trifunctional purine biosynthetic protein adenosine-3 [Nomia mela
MAHTVLVIGGGGREHAIVWKLSLSPHVNKIYVSPGNIGMTIVDKVSLIKLNVGNNKEVTKWSKDNHINLVVIGPEEYLANGLADELENVGIHCFGPQKAASRIEADKYWAKKFMDRHQIPTARWKGFTDADEAKKFVINTPYPALVIKAAGLAAGKGVIVAKDKQEACSAIDNILTEKRFGPAGESIVIEELLEGEEVSVLAFTDGKTVVPMAPAQDHKRIFNGDMGPNTGGMGAYCPCPLLPKEDCKLVKSDVLQKAITGLRQEKIPFVGVLYAGLMLTKDGPKVLEFNCRFGDPETQVVLPLLNSDLFTIMKACCEGSLTESQVSWQENVFAVGVILASRGYPISSSKGQVITGVNNILSKADHFVFHSGTSISPEGKLVTNGGRVLITVSLASSLALAAAKATHAAQKISFEGKQFRTDIAHKGIARSILHNGKLTYKSSGVDIVAGDLLVSAIKPATCSTQRLGTIGSIGSFGGLFDIKATGYKDPILVSGTDGVGTKLKIAFEYNKHDTVGVDLVAMCVNDVLAHGAEPLFFLDYFACGELNINVASDVINGVSEGCKRAGCSLIGGETAEMPDMYSHGEYDLAGFAVGAVERDRLLPRLNDIKDGDIVIGLPSNGIHSNGFSLVRKIIKLADKKYSDIAPFSEKSRTIGEELLEPTKIYVKGVISAMQTNLVKAFAHITGGGLTENIPRVLPKNMRVELDANKWKIQPIFSWLAATGEINKEEMLKTFNCGIGAVLICSPKDKDEVLLKLQAENPVVIGHISNHKDNEVRVNVRHFETALEVGMKRYVPNIVTKLIKPLKRVGVLISGSGTNLQSLIDATQDQTQHIGAEIVLVISNKPNVEGLKRAERAGIKTMVFKHTDYPSREAFDSAINVELDAAEVNIVCLAGFMRILSNSFVNKWRGALINVHPSLLPSFKGAYAHKDVLAAGVRVSGCTVHFVEVDIDSGAIIEQAAVPVLPNDTVETLQERVKTAEHYIFPLALKHLANGRITLKEDNTIKWNY